MSDSNLPSDQARPLADEEWLGQVFRQHQRSLMGYATHLMGDAERAADVVQDTFVRLCKQPREVVQGRVRSWLFTVCRNRALDVLKKENRMKRSEDAVLKEPSRSRDPQVAAQQRDSARFAGQLINDLPKNQQEVIRLKVEGGLSYREISEVTGLSVSNVGFLLHTGLKSVRSRLATIE